MMNGHSKTEETPDQKTGHVNLGAIGDDGSTVNQKPLDNAIVDIASDIQDPGPPKRQQWTKQREFILSSIALVIGYGNLWRFPFNAYDNGGGAFLVPYILVLIFIGRPILYMEYILGQFASCNNIKLWELSPAFRGVGYGQFLTSLAVVSFYVSLMSLCIYYFFGSFSSVLPWAICGSWSSVNCIDANTPSNFSSLAMIPVTAAEEYFMHEVLKADPQGFDNGIGLPDWWLALCLLFCWSVVFCVQIRGVKSSGKVSYFTATFPYVVLLTMLIRGVTLPGAQKGILFLITPKWEKLLELQVWYAAASQALFSLAVGFGPAIVYASYNSFSQNIYRDALFISFLDTVTCIFSGLTVFSALGHLSELLGVEIQDVVKGGGTPLAFISYADVLARFEHVPQLFSGLFFLMLFTIGVGSVSAGNQYTISLVCDAYPKVRQWQVLTIVCLIGFFTGLLYTTPQGQHILTLVNHYGASVSLIFLMVLQLIGVTWVYGIRNFTEDIEFMLNRKVGLYWKICWAGICPVFLLVVFVYHNLTAERLNYGSYVFGDAPTYAGMVLSALSFLMVPVFFFVELFQRWNGDISTWCNVKNLFKPTTKWSPRDPKLREEYRQFKLNIRLKNIAAAADGSE